MAAAEAESEEGERGGGGGGGGGGGRGGGLASAVHGCSLFMTGISNRYEIFPFIPGRCVTLIKFVCEIRLIRDFVHGTTIVGHGA